MSGKCTLYEVNALHTDRQHVDTVLSRTRLSGGVAATDSYVRKLSTWFRTLGSRGWTSAEFMSQPELVRVIFKQEIPNSSTRSQYVKSFLKYLAGLTEEEYKTEYPNLDRRQQVTLLHSVTRAPPGQAQTRLDDQK